MDTVLIKPVVGCRTFCVRLENKIHFGPIQPAFLTALASVRSLPREKKMDKKIKSQMSVCWGFMESAIISFSTTEVLHSPLWGENGDVSRQVPDKHMNT